MRRIILLAALGVVALLFLGSSPIWAQGAVINGDFETGSLTPIWTPSGGTTNTEIVLFETKAGWLSHCLRREIGPAAYNGGIEQKVFLVGGVPYIFSADIAAQYCVS
jgi:hypothetical protein